jgi:hypothetical protein
MFTRPCDGWVAKVGPRDIEPGHDRPPGKGSHSVWKTFAVFSGAGLQLGVSIVVFAYLGRLAGLHYHKPWLIAVGTLVGIVVGVSGLAVLVKQMLGDLR